LILVEHEKEGKKRKRKENVKSRQTEREKRY
jgi:hypothetical protein